MDNLKESPTNQKKIARIDAALWSMLDEMLRHGVHGQATLEVMIVDGTIHRIARRVEHIER